MGSIGVGQGIVDSIVSRVEFIVGEIKIRVLMVLVLAKLFLRRQLIYPKVNFPLVAMCSLILGSVYSIGSSSYKVLNSNLGTIAFLYFLIYTPLVHRNVQSFQIPIQLQSLKICIIKFQKSSLQTSYSSLSLRLYALYSRVLNFINLLISFIVVLLDYRLMPLGYFFYSALTCALMSDILIVILLGSS